ncbi:MAG: DUF393 domain-containing protein [Phycisphaerae bacterium]|nr:DUF393 domain-containing protein [Phycisphaerae bacterium]
MARPVTIFYDSECPFCVREVEWLARRAGASSLQPVDVASSEFDPRPYGRTVEEFMARIHGLDEHGELIEGMDVFRAAYRAAGLGWLIAPTAWPLLRPLCNLGYRVFARYRVRLGRLFGRKCESGQCDVR